MVEPAAHRRCPRCSKPLERTDLVVFDASELVHQACYVKSGGAYDLVVEFLRRHTPSPFCHQCISVSLRLAYEDTHKVVTTLRMQREFVLLLGAQCAGCRQLRVTVQAVET